MPNVSVVAPLIIVYRAVETARIAVTPLVVRVFRSPFHGCLDPGPGEVHPGLRVDWWAPPISISRLFSPQYE